MGNLVADVGQCGFRKLIVTALRLLQSENINV
jgi:hypothetical protein